LDGTAGTYFYGYNSLPAKNHEPAVWSVFKKQVAFKNNLIALLDQTYPSVKALFDSPVREMGARSGGILLRPFGT
jgi:hypothetical protein